MPKTASRTCASPLESASEEKLLAMIQSGSMREQEAAFTIIYNSHKDRVERMIRFKGIQGEDAQDIFGDVWKIVVEKLPTFEYWGKPLWRWLSRITKIQIDAYFRRQKEYNGRCTPINEEWLEILTYIESMFGEKNSAAPSPTTKRLIDKTLPMLLATLPKIEKQILIYSYYHDQDSSQIAKKLRIKPGTIRQKKRRALKKLSDYVKLKEGCDDL